jgi:DNA repair exonuclease SbcCD ATPase subunit
MTEEVKSDKKEVEIEFTHIGYELNSTKGTIEELKERLVKIAEEEDHQNDDKLKEIKEKIDEYDKLLKPLIDSFDKLETKLESEKINVDKKKSKLAEEKQRLITVNKELELYKNDKCPTCQTDLTVGIHLDKKEELKNSLISFGKKVESEKKNLVKLETSIKKLNDKYHDLISDKTLYETKVKFLKNQVVELVKNKDKKKDSPNISGLKKMLLNYESTLKEKEVEQGKFEKEKHFYMKVEDILSKKGIKQMVINNILPLLNDNISVALEDLDVNFTVRIDNQFNCVVSSLGTEINVKTLSSGERTRVDTAILLSLIKLIKLQFPSLNIFFLDEIFSNIDMESIDTMVRIVKGIAKDLELTVFLVAHSPVSEILFDKKIILNKSNTFSEMTIEDLR